MKTAIKDIPKKSCAILAEAASSFRKNNDLTMASSLAFTAMLALIPALFLVTFLLGTVIGSSGRAAQQTQDLMVQLIPAYSQDILREVSALGRHRRALGLLNLVVLFWTITPLVADLRVTLGRIFRRRPARPFLLEKLFDAAIGMVFLVGLSLAAVAGFVLSALEQIRSLRLLPGYLGEPALFAVVTGVALALYFTFSKRARFRHLLAGAVVTALLWFALRPAFHLFLAYNPGYGLAFGSFKSLFVVVIWIFISLALFLFGAEVAAVLGRNNAVHIKHLLEGRRNVPAGIRDRYVVRYEKDSVIFRDGDPGTEMYAVLKGRVLIRKDGAEAAVIRQGKSFGGLSFLLSSTRVATATALDDVELVTLNNENINSLMNEFPEFIVGMLRDIALRVRETSRMID